MATSQLKTEITATGTGTFVKETKKCQNAVDDFDKSVKKANQSLGSKTNAERKALLEARKHQQEMKMAAKHTKELQGKFKNLTDQINNVTSKFGVNVKGIDSMIFKFGKLTGVIGGVCAAGKLLVDSIKTNDSMMDKFRVTTGKMKDAYSGFVTALGNNGIDAFAKNFKDIMQASENFTKALDDAGTYLPVLNTQLAISQTKYENLIGAARDVALADVDRLEALNAASEELQHQFEISQKIARIRLGESESKLLKEFQKRKGNLDISDNYFKAASNRYFEPAAKGSKNMFKGQDVLQRAPKSAHEAFENYQDGKFSFNGWLGFLPKFQDEGQMIGFKDKMSLQDKDFAVFKIIDEMLQNDSELFAQWMQDVNTLKTNAESNNASKAQISRLRERLLKGDKSNTGNTSNTKTKPEPENKLETESKKQFESISGNAEEAKKAITDLRAEYDKLNTEKELRVKLGLKDDTEKDMLRVSEKIKSEKFKISLSIANLESLRDEMKLGGLDTTEIEQKIEELKKEAGDNGEEAADMFSQKLKETLIAEIEKMDGTIDISSLFTLDTSSIVDLWKDMVDKQKAEEDAQKEEQENYEKLLKKKEEANEKLKESYTEIAEIGANSFTSIASSVQGLVDLMDDEDATAADWLGAISEMMTNIVGQVGSVIGGINAITAAKQASAAATEAANMKEASSAATATAAEVGKGMAGATSSAAGIMFPGNIVAIAAGIAAVIGVIAMIAGMKSKAKKNARGGIIKGATTMVDEILTRVNAGEMILNNRQQQHLFNILDKGIITQQSGNSGGSVEFRIEGSTLVGALKNHEKKHNRL